MMMKNDDEWTMEKLLQKLPAFPDFKSTLRENCKKKTMRATWKNVEYVHQCKILITHTLITIEFSFTLDTREELRAPESVLQNYV